MDLLRSKKFQAALIGLAVVVIKHFVPEIDEGLVRDVLAILGVYILGQGIADAGKEKAKIEQGAK